MIPITAATTATATAAQATPQPRLVRAAHEFEAQMMKELMEPLNHPSSLTSGDSDGDDDTGSASALGEFASEALSRALSDRGGFGIAASIVRQLTPSSNRVGAAQVTKKPHANTVVKATID